MCSHALFGLQKHPTNMSEYEWVPFALHGGLECSFPCWMLFCQPAPLLLSVTWQPNMMEYWWEGSASAAMLPTSASAIMSRSGLMVVPAILTEVSVGLSENSDDVFLFLYFMLDHNCSQMLAVSKPDDTNKVWL